jgi:Co/Zn/Cd efflux system component
VKKSGGNLIEETNLDTIYALKKKQTLKFNFWIIFGTWLPFVFIALLSNSLTLIAQMIMGGAQSLSVLLSWRSTWRSHKLQKHLPNSERLNAQFMAWVFIASFIIVVGMAVDRIIDPRELNNDVALFGLIVNSFAVVVNLIQWRKNLILSKQNFSLVMESQHSLFFIKFFTVLTVEISLLLYFLLEGKGVHDYIDSVFSVALALLTLYSAFQLFRKSNVVKE